MELPWVVGGDFNVILHEDEKIGSKPVHAPYEDFAFSVNSSGLFDVGFKGSPFAWWNGRPNVEYIFKILDRIFVNIPFQNLFPAIEVEHLLRTGSDHAPLFLSCGQQAINYVVRQNWHAGLIGDHFLMFKQKLKKVKSALSKWSKATYGDIFKQLVILEDIVKVKEMPFEEEPTIDNRIVLQKAQAELKKYLNIEEQYWKQKARMTWFAEVGRNTSFFHNHVNGKSKKLQLKRIKNEDGDWVEDQDQMANVVVDFYQRQLSKEAGPTGFTLLNNVPSMVTMEQNLEICRYPILEEVKGVVF
ncbi:uncharacterized protein [Nicotiana tomentosiformis]|uniref:uncharacterized protein n=1 Tax=Nicotiana tomentosiformis TaxID=4098 RepID=UPI00388C58D6